MTESSSQADGYLLLHKKPGISSFDALNLIKKALGTKRVGHSGTLDKFAEGLLVVLVGRSTRLVPWFTGCDKVYEGDFIFGAETDTLDPEGEIIAEAPVPTASAIRESLFGFVGDLMQVPPLYSAIHVDGKRAHAMARAGETIEMKPRPVTIRSLDLISYEAPVARIRVECSKGTYIRSLARDIALSCASRGRLEALIRLKVAGFDLADAVDPSTADDPASALRGALRRIDEKAFKAIGVPTVEVNAAASITAAHGKPIDPLWLGNQAEADSVALFTEDGRFLAVCVFRNGARSYGYVALRPEEL